MKTYEINTQRGAQSVTRQQALLHAARVLSQKDVGRDITAPRGEKRAFVETAKNIRTIRMMGLDAAYNANFMRVHISHRVDNRLIEIGNQQFAKRMISTSAGWDHLRQTILDRQPDLWLVNGHGWYKYSSRVGSYYQSATFLCGRDEGQITFVIWNFLSLDAHQRSRYQRAVRYSPRGPYPQRWWTDHRLPGRTNI